MPKKTLNIGLIGYLFMGKAHSNGWRQAPRFFDMKHGVRLHTICGRNAAAVEKARKQWMGSCRDRLARGGRQS